jgi:hypothetical protein
MDKIMGDRPLSAGPSSLVASTELEDTQDIQAPMDDTLNDSHGSNVDLEAESSMENESGHDEEKTEENKSSLKSKKRKLGPSQQFAEIMKDAFTEFNKSQEKHHNQFLELEKWRIKYESEQEAKRREEKNHELKMMELFLRAQQPVVTSTYASFASASTPVSLPAAQQPQAVAPSSAYINGEINHELQYEEL